jgi:hypothetical protein
MIMLHGTPNRPGQLLRPHRSGEALRITITCEPRVHRRV